MNKEQLQQMIVWLNRQIEFSSDCINSAHVEMNYGKETRLEGMRDAFAECLSKLENE